MAEDVFDPAYDRRSIDDIKESCGIDSVEVIKGLMTQNYEFFLEHVLGLNVDSDLIQDVVDIVQNPPEQTSNNGTKIAVMAPRGHSKTYSWTVARALYVALTESGKRVILTSASRSQSKGILTSIKRIIERNELLNFLKPSKENRENLADSMDLADDEGAWANKSIVTTSDVAIVTKTFGSTIRSEHVNYVFCDDILTDENSGKMSKQQEKDVFYNVISPIAENKSGTIQVVGTPQSHNDLLMELMSKNSYYTTEYKAYDPDSKDPLWDFNWTYDKLMNKKEEIGPARFAREYMCNPMSVEEQFFSWEDAIKPNLDKHRDETNWKPNDMEQYSDWNFYVAVDIALSGSSTADYTVAQVLGVTPEDAVYHVDMVREKGMSPPGIADMIERLDSKYGFSHGLVEKNSLGEGVWDEISKRASLSGRIESFDTTRKTRPELLSRLQAALYSNRLVLHDTEVMVDELMAFYKNDKGKLEGKKHDDTVMALALAWRAAAPGSAAQTSATIIGENGSEISIDDVYEDNDVGLDDLEGSKGVGII